MASATAITPTFQSVEQKGLDPWTRRAPQPVAQPLPLTGNPALGEITTSAYQRIFGSSTYENAADKFQPDLQATAELLGRARRELDQGEDPTNTVVLLESKQAELEIADKVISRRFADVREKLRSGGQDEMVAKWDAIEGSYRSRFASLQRQLTEVNQSWQMQDMRKSGAALPGDSRLDGPSLFRAALDSTANDLETVIPKPSADSSPPPTLIMPPLSLPREPASLTASASPEERPTVASLAPLSDPAPEDLAEGPGVALTPEIRQLAQSLGNNPVRIFDYVRNNIEYEPYEALVKGSTATLWTGRGNDWDMASLLIALLRASGIPARYEVGTAGVLPEHAKAWLGVSSLSAVQRYFRFAGNPASFSADGRFLYLRRVWVRAYVPYGHYRGTGEGGEDRLWIPLDPTYKAHDMIAGLTLDVTFDEQTYLSRVQRFLPIEAYEDQIRQFLAANFPGRSTTEIVQMGEIIREDYPFLPSTSPLAAAPEASFARPPDNYLRKSSVRITDAAGNTVLTTTFAVADIIQDRLTIAYVPADQASQTAIDLFGGLDSVPVPLVSVKPVLRREGQIVAEGTAVPLGTSLKLDVTIGVPWLDEFRQNHAYQIRAGAYHSLVLGALQVSDKLLGERSARLLAALQQGGTSQAAMDDILGELLYIAGLRYHQRVVASKSLQARLSRQKMAYFPPDLILTRADTNVSYVFDIPFSVFTGDLLIDATGTTSPLPIDGEWDAVRQHREFYLAVFNSSALEHQLWEELVKLDAISTVKGLQVANESGIPILHIDSSNVNQLLPQVQPEWLRTQLGQRIAGGSKITVPATPVTRNQWTGPVWLEDRPSTITQTGLLGFFIGGGLRGGSTTTNKIVIEPYKDRTGSDKYTIVQNGDPVNVTNGNLIHEETDIQLPGRGLGFSLKRSYNSKLDYEGPFGYGWTHTYDTGLIVQQPSGDVLHRGADGGIDVYTRQVDGSFRAPPGIQSTLTLSGTTYMLRDLHGLEYRYDSTGRLTRIVDLNGNQLTPNYDTAGRLKTVVDTVGRVITFTHNASGLIESVVDPIGRTWQYEYDAARNLTAAVDPLGKAERYGYYTTTASLAHNIYQVIDKNGNAMTFYYYENDKVFRYTDALGNTRTFSYNPFWQETRVIDENGYTRVYDYDEVGNLIKLTRETGGIETYTYDANRNMVSRTDPFGNTTTYEYDAKGNPTRVVDALGHTVSYQYEPVYNKRTRTEDEGRVTTAVYDIRGNLTSVTDPLANTTTVAYDAHGQAIMVTGPLNNVTVNTYDGQGNLTAVRDALGHTAQNQYDAVGRPTQTTDANSNVTMRSYDLLDRLVGVTDPLGQVARRAYDAAGNLTFEVNTAGYTTTHAYDAANRKIRTTDALGGITSFEYNGLGELIGVTDPLGNRTAYQYDALGNQKAIVDPLGNVTEFVYDANSRLIRRIDPNGNATTYRYDRLNRLIGATDPLSNTTWYEYDVWGNRTAVTDANGNTTRSYYDALNRLVRTQDALGHQVGYQYDALGDLTQITDANGNPYRQGFDLLGRLTSVTDALGNTTRNEYDAVGNQTRLVDAKGVETNLSYDALSRLTRRTYADGTFDSFRYDAAGNPVEAANLSTALTREYDALRRLTVLTDSRFGKSIRYRYDAAGRQIEMTDPEGAFTGYSYDAGGRLLEQTMADGASVSYAYDPGGRRIERRLSLGHLTTYTYDGAGRLISLINAAPDGSAISESRYAYDAVGNRLSTIDQQGTSYYAYNSVYWLVGAVYPKGDFELFTYDAAGNRTRRTGSGGTVDYTYNTANQLTSAGQTFYAYDRNGNLAQRTGVGGTATYTFDQRNRLTGVHFPDGSGLPDTAIEYNALGDRMRKTDSEGTLSYFVNEQREVLSEYGGDDSWLATYQLGPILDETVARWTAAETYYYFADALRSVVAIADGQGQVLAANDYSAFGKVMNREGALLDRWGFTGRELDADSGLLYLRNRYYDPETGRFVSADPIGYRGGLNLYHYVQNNPINFVDPLGTDRYDPNRAQQAAEAEAAEDHWWGMFEPIEGLFDPAMTGVGAAGIKGVKVKSWKTPSGKTIPASTRPYPGGAVWAQIDDVAGPWATGGTVGLSTLDQVVQDYDNESLSTSDKVARGMGAMGTSATTAAAGLLLGEVLLGAVSGPPGWIAGIGLFSGSMVAGSVLKESEAEARQLLFVMAGLEKPPFVRETGFGPYAKRWD